MHSRDARKQQAEVCDDIREDALDSTDTTNSVEGKEMEEMEEVLSLSSKHSGNEKKPQSEEFDDTDGDTEDTIKTIGQATSCVLNDYEEPASSSCMEHLAGTRTDGIFLSFLTQTNLEDTEKAKTTRCIVFYYNLIMYVVILMNIVCICHTDPEFQILGPNITWSELEIVKEKFCLHLAVGISIGFGFLSLAIDICLFCCKGESVFQGSSNKNSENRGPEETMNSNIGGLSQ